MSILNLGHTAIVLERVVAVEYDEPFSDGEAVRVFLSGMLRPIEMFVEDPEATYLQICAALSKLQPQDLGALRE